MTYLAVSISAATPEKAQQQINQVIRDGAELIELRMDYWETVNAQILTELIQAVHSRQKPVLVTCRSKEEGGVRFIEDTARIEILCEAVKAGADFVDCEYHTYRSRNLRQPLETVLSAHSSCRLLLSCHDFKGDFEDLHLLYESMVTVCPKAVIKLVYTVHSISDNFEAFDLLYEKDPGQDLAVLTMGPAALISRVLAKKFGSFLTFACSDPDTATAPGQVPLKQMKQLFRWDHLNDQTEVFGLIGNPVGHSLSPAIYNACFEAAGIDAVYLPFLVEGGQEEFDVFLRHVLFRPWLNVGGFSVTIPHKTHALAFALEGGNFVESLPARIGAVNTLKVGFNGIVTGFNTDQSGALDALTETMGIKLHDLHEVHVAVLGAGGASRAVVAGLADAGAHVTIYNRTLSKAQAMAGEFHCQAAPLEAISEHDAEVVINCTSIGMHPHTDASPMPANAFRTGMVAFDTVYNPLNTLFLQHAHAAGAKTVNGAEMFIRQAVAQYRHFIGQYPNEKLIRKIVKSTLS